MRINARFVLQEGNLAGGDVEAALLCLREKLAIVDGELRVVDERVVRVVVFLLEILSLRRLSLQLD